MTDDELWAWRVAVYRKTVDENPWVVKKPAKNAKQRTFLLFSDVREMFYGGSGGGGKSIAILQAAAQFVDVPGYRALLLRENFRDLEAAWILESKEWWTNTGAVWNQTNTRWTFPSGAMIEFGYMDRDSAVYQYDGPEFQFIGIDEVTQHSEWRYKFLFARLRKKIEGPLSQVPLRVRCASNPGGKGHCVEYGSILTPNGWRDVRDFKVGDPVYAVAPDGRLVRSIVEQVHAVPYSGDMVRVSGRGLEMNCTPDHRVAKLGGARLDRGKLFTLTPFDELPGQAVVLRSVKWEGARIDRFSPAPFQTRARKVNQPASVSGDQYAELMGWFLSEGTVIHRDKGFGICQMKPDGRAKIEDLLNRCGFKYSKTETVFNVYAADWWAYLSQFGKCRDKFIPAELRNASPDQLRLLFDALMAGDGHWARSSSGQYYTTSKRLAEDVAEVALKLGYVVSINFRQRKNRKGLSYTVNFKMTRSGGTELLTGNHVYDVKTKTARKSSIRRESFNGMVYCIGVPDHHAFVIMQDGCVWVSGNSWVKKRFVDARTREKDVLFIPATQQDNIAYLNIEDYRESLAKLDPITRRQRELGDWDAVEGGRFRREWFAPRYKQISPNTFRLYSPGKPDRVVCPLKDIYQTCDPAASDKTSADYTVLCTWGVTDRHELLLLDVVRVQMDLPDIPKLILAHYRKWNASYCAIEAVGGNSSVLQYCRREPMVVKGLNPRGKDKLVRATPAMVFAESGRFYLPQASSWLEEIEAELFLFTGDESKDSHDDVVDAISYGVWCVDMHGPKNSSFPPYVHQNG